MMMTRRRDAGVSMVLVVILVLLAVILVITAIILFANTKDLERQQAAMKKEEERLIAEGEELKARMSKVVEPTGFALEENLLPLAKAKARADQGRLEYWSAPRLGRLPLETPKGLPQDQEVAFKKATEESGLYSTLQDQVVLAAAWTQLTKNRADQLQLELDAAKEMANSREAIKPEINKSKTLRAEELTKRIQGVNDDTAKENEAYTARKTKLSEDKTKSEMEIEAANAEYAQYQILIENKTKDLRRQLEELKIKEVISHEITRAHGKVLAPDIPNKMAFIDIGSRERVVTGLKFMVGKFGVGGHFEYKGKIEVKKAWTTHSECSINEVLSKDRPIIEGDVIINPLFNKQRPVVVTFAGEERPARLRYAVDEATRRIREIGSEVRKDVSLDVDFVIFTTGTRDKTPDSYDVYKEAVFLEVPIAQAGRSADAPDRPGIFDFLGD
jgi:hypothetical protein